MPMAQMCYFLRESGFPLMINSNSHIVHVSTGAVLDNVAFSTVHQSSN